MENFWMLMPADAERTFGMPKNEKDAIQELFQNRHSITVHDVPPGSTVIPRFRAIPFGKELEAEVIANGSQLLNTYREHRNIANLFNWVHLLDGLTAPAYTVEDIPNLPAEGEWFVKGETNSVKNRWFTHCYANGRASLLEVVRNNQMDGWVGSQQIAIRPYERFRPVAEAVDGRPVFNEWRVFILDGKVISEGWYWSSFVADVPEEAREGVNPGRRQEVLSEAINRISHLARFIVIDLAETLDGDWRVVELNDGSMSGLSENDPNVVWSAFTN